MTDKFLHEAVYRGEPAMARLTQPLFVVCGAGAIGSHLVENLARQGVRRLRVIDFDRVEDHNVSTQTHGIDDVGALKVDVLRHRLFRTVGVEVEAVAKKIDDRSIRKLLKGADIVVDALDNSTSRRCVTEHCRAASTPCLHVGLFADYCEVIWNESYRVPDDAAEDICEYPLARNLVLLAVALSSESLLRFVLAEETASRSATLGDFAVQTLEA